MIQSKQKVKDLCDKLFQVKPHQIIIDLVQDDIEEAVYDNNVTPDTIGSLSYQASSILRVYNPEFKSDIEYLTDLHSALDAWSSDAQFANRSLGLDPNK